MIKKFNAVILAAGEGKRYISSGGERYKQVVPFQNKPIIRRAYDILYDHPAIDSVRIVVGNNSSCVNQIQEVLPKNNVNFIFNDDSHRDNNQLSFLVGTENLQGSVIIIEADCVYESNDISAIASITDTHDITWANIGSLSNFDYGGVVFVDDYGKVNNINILDHQQMTDIKSKKNKGLKMFGIAAFGEAALKKYRKTILEQKNLYGRYFHSAAVDYPEKFSFKTVKMSKNAFSFNTIFEFEDIS